MNSRYYLTLKATFFSEKLKKLEKTRLNVKFFDWDYLHHTAQTKETYFRSIIVFLEYRMRLEPIRMQLLTSMLLVAAKLQANNHPF